MPRYASQTASRILLLAVAFATFAVAIMARPPKSLRDFDQSFYLTIAYDIDHHGVFSNGIFSKMRYSIFSDGSLARNANADDIPISGMFFVPGFPLLTLAVMKVDKRFAAAVECSVEVNFNKRDAADCETYATPMHVVHALLLAIAVVSIALSGELIFESGWMFYLAGAFAMGSFSAEAEILSFVMTESMTVSLYSIFAFISILAWKTSRISYFALAGMFLGLLCLTRLSFIVLMPAFSTLILLQSWWLAKKSARCATGSLLAFAVACLIVIGPWAARNRVSVGKWGLSEEYGSAALIERFAYNDMTVREYVLAFPYCTPGIGDLAFDRLHGNDSMHRFFYDTAESFFQVGRRHRNLLVKEFGRLDPLIAGVTHEEMRANWWRHLLVSIPLGWCAIWVGWLWSLLLIPPFLWACFRSPQPGRRLLLLYSVPSVVMLCLHAFMAGPDTRYNLILVGPIAVGAAWSFATFQWNIFLRLAGRSATG